MKYITKHQILDLVKDGNFKNEDEFRDFLIPKLMKLFKIGENEIERESVTTSFDYTLSNRADIIIKTKEDNFKKALIVFELKLSKNVEKFKGGSYDEADKQLKKYCQDTRAPFGVLLTEDFCAIYRNKYFSYDQEPKRISENKIPSIKKIKDIMVFEALWDFIFYDGSLKYVLIAISLLLIFSSFISTVTKIYGLLTALIISLLLNIAVGLFLPFIFKKRKTFD